MPGAVAIRPTSHQVHHGRSHSWNHSTAGSGDEFLNIELFTSVQEAKLLAEQHRIEYSTYRSHSALQIRTPLEILHQWEAA